MYCIRYYNLNGLGQAFFRPYNSVRDSETYSSRYVPTSFIDGIKSDYGLKSKKIRHKIKFNKSVDNSDQIKFNTVSYNDDGIISSVQKGVYIRHSLTDVDLILGFDNKEDAIQMSRTPIYLGQTEYQVYPCTFTGEISFDDNDFISELNDDEFSELPGVETFPADEDGIFIGFSRNRNNEKMFINIDRKEW